MAVVQHHAADADRGSRLARAGQDALDYLRWRHLVVRLVRHYLVRQDRLAVRAVDVAQAAVLLVDIVEGDPRRHHVIARIAPEVGVVLMVGLGAADRRRLHEDLVSRQLHRSADHRFQQGAQLRIEQQGAKPGVAGVRTADLARRPYSGCRAVDQVVARRSVRCPLQVAVTDVLRQRRDCCSALRGEYPLHYGPAALPIAPPGLRPAPIVIAHPTGQALHLSIRSPG